MKLHFVDWGGRGHALVLLAGLGGTAHLFRSLGTELARQFRVVGFTRRGHGRSDVPESGYDLDTLVDDVGRFLNTHHVERAVLVGHSFAGLEMTRFAIRHPDRVSALVYLDALDVTFEPADPAGDPAVAALEPVPTEKDLASPMAYLAFQRRRPDIGSIWCDAVEADKLEDMTVGGVRDPRAARARQRTVGPKLFEGLAAPDYAAAANVPMLAIVPAGLGNPFVASDASAELREAANRFWIEHSLPRVRRRTNQFRRAVPEGRVVELDTSNHTVFIARERETVAAITEFLGEQLTA